MGEVVSIKEKVKQRIRDQAKDGGGSGDGLDSKFIIECLNQNELGDGELFKKLYRDDFVFNKSMDCWMYWTGHLWSLDKMDYALASVEGVAKAYLDEARRISKKITELESKGEDVGHLKTKQRMLNQRVSALRSNRRRKNCVLFAHTSKAPLAIDGVEVDQKPWLLPCKTGVINLKTGELEPGRHKDYLMKASPIEWPKDGIEASSEVWKKS